jgi:hypothetical protein
VVLEEGRVDTACYFILGPAGRECLGGLGGLHRIVDLLPMAVFNGRGGRLFWLFSGRGGDGSSMQGRAPGLPGQEQPRTLKSFVHDPVYFLSDFLYKIYRGA